MTTFLKDFVISIDEKWEEIDLLVQNAKNVQDKDEKLYNVICRSITVLLVAHLEGFTKNIVKNVIHDLNRNCDFSSLPNAAKRTYCRKYLGNKPDKKVRGYENKISQLVKKFEDLECKISHEPFFFSKNRNPSANVLQIVFNNFGISNVFECLHKSHLEEMFSWTPSEIQLKINELRTYILNGTEGFPYDVKDEDYGLTKSKINGKTLWEEFLEQINQKRHLIAHGNAFDNVDNIAELELRKLKILLIQFAFITILASKISKKES